LGSRASFWVGRWVARGAHAWVISASANLVVRVGVVAVFVGIAVVGFQRGGYFVVLGVLFALLSLGALLVYAFWGLAVFGGETFARWLTRRRSNRGDTPGR